MWPSKHMEMFDKDEFAILRNGFSVEWGSTLFAERKTHCTCGTQTFFPFILSWESFLSSGQAREITQIECEVLCDNVPAVNCNYFKALGNQLQRHYRKL